MSLRFLDFCLVVFGMGWDGTGWDGRNVLGHRGVVLIYSTRLVTRGDNHPKSSGRGGMRRDGMKRNGMRYPWVSGLCLMTCGAAGDPGGQPSQWDGMGGEGIGRDETGRDGMSLRGFMLG